MRSTSLDALRQRQIDLARDIKAAETAARERTRREDQRRNQLAGDAALKRMSEEPASAFAATLLGLINERARSSADRALFGLAPLGGTDAP